MIIMACSFTGCIDIFETFNIKDDGSGVYEQKMDFTRAMQGMMAMMSEKGRDNMSSKKKMEKKDSTFSLKSMIDTASSLSSSEKTVFGKANATMHLDEAKGEMVIIISYPFANAAEFATIQAVMSRNETSGSLFDALMSAADGKMKNKGMGGMGQEGDGSKKEGLPISQYMYSLSGNGISRKIKNPNDSSAAPKKNELDDMPEEMKKMMQEMMMMNITTIINTPKPVKDFQGNNGTLSNDKKQIRFSKQVNLDTKLSSVDFDFNVNY